MVCKYKIPLNITSDIIISNLLCLRYTMENIMDLCSTEDGYNSSSIVLEKQVFRSKVPESHVQLACSLHYCAFPLNGNELCIWNMSDEPNHQVKYKFLCGH